MNNRRYNILFYSLFSSYSLTGDVLLTAEMVTWKCNMCKTDKSFGFFMIREGILQIILTNGSMPYTKTIPR